MKPERWAKICNDNGWDEKAWHAEQIMGVIDREVAEAEQTLIERCAQVCEQLPETEPALFASTPYNSVALTKQLCATAIRALQPGESRDKADAERWKCLSLLWFAGEVELSCDDEGQFTLLSDPAEYASSFYKGDSPESTIDAARALPREEV